MRLKKILKDLYHFQRLKNISYSQSGEDLIIKFLFDQLGVVKPSYLDIGAHHPTYLNNTFYFYQRGSAGVNIEPDPYLFDAFLTDRSNDTNLNIGVGVDGISRESTADFFIMSARTLNTFSKEEAERVQNFGSIQIENIVKVPLIDVNYIIEKYFSNNTPDLVSIDVEGLDYEIIKRINFSKFRPAVICIETITYNEDKKERKQTEIIEYLCENNYIIYADTYINTIFVEGNIWKSR